MKKLIVFMMALVLINVSHAQNSDTTKVSNISNKEEANRNVMLNADNSSKPREISIGIPSIGGTEIYEDGIPVSQYYWPVSHHYHWAGGSSYSSQGLMKIGENAISSGNVGYAINSFTQLGTDELHGKANFITNIFGLIKFDGNINGSLGKGYYFTAGAYANLEPTSVRYPSITFLEKTQIYKVGLTKRWDNNKGEVSLLYKFSKINVPFNGYNTAPFYYVGDGSIDKYNNFRLGTDSYMPENDLITYMDLHDGKFYSGNLKDMSKKQVHDMMLKFDYNFDTDTKLEVNVRLGLSPNVNTTIIKNSGIDMASTSSDYSYADGAQYTGFYQRRLGIFFKAETRDIMATAQLKKTADNHDYRFGFNAWHNYQDLSGSTFVFAHTVEVNPDRVFLNNKDAWSYNDCGEFYEGTETKTALFATDEWSLSEKLNIYYGLRMEYDMLDINTAANVNGETRNSRSDGFVIDDELIYNYKKGFLNPTAMLNGSYRISKTFSLAGDYLFSRRRVRLDNFCGSSLPGNEPIDTHLGRFGIVYDNSWLQLTSMASYIKNSNNKQTAHFTKSINGVSETQAKTIAYDIATLGWTTDAVINPFDGFTMHALVTLQNPLYKNFDTFFSYSDGSSETLSYSNKYVSGISKVLLEIDPSYEIQKWKFWLSLRYYSKQYANKMNNVCFNGHWETFGGIDYKVIEKLSLSLNVVNIFNQTGANGSIASADLVTDPSTLNNYLISGTYIRPFTVELAIKYAF